MITLAIRRNLTTDRGGQRANVNQLPYDYCLITDENFTNRLLLNKITQKILVCIIDECKFRKGVSILLTQTLFQAPITSMF